MSRSSTGPCSHRAGQPRRHRRVARINGAWAAEPSLLGGLLLDAQGERMSPSHAVKKNKRYRYYTSQSLLRSRSRKAGQVTRVPAYDIEAVVIAEVRSLLQDPGALLDMLTGMTLDLAEQQVLLQAAAAFAERGARRASGKILATYRLVRPSVRAICRREEAWPDRSWSSQ